MKSTPIARAVYLPSKEDQQTKGLGTWIVASTSGVFIRAQPLTEATDKGILKHRDEIIGLKIQGRWIQHAKGWSLLKKEDGTVLIGEKWVVTAKQGLRVRDSPKDENKQIGILVYEERLAQLKRQGDWLEHEKGWSRIVSVEGVPLLALVSSGGKKDDQKKGKEGKSTGKLTDSAPSLPNFGDDTDVELNKTEGGSTIRMTQKETETFHGQRRRISAVPEYMKLPEVKLTLGKKGSLGIFREVHIRMWKYALFISSVKEKNILDDEEKLIEVEKSLRETGNTLDKKTGIMIIPLEIVTEFEGKKNGKVTVHVNCGFIKKDKITFMTPSKSAHEANSVAEKLTEHLKAYRAGAKTS